MSREVEKLIDDQQAGLQPIRLRTHLLQKVQSELTQRCAGKPYFIWDGLVYRMLSDMKSMVFVMLSDWARTQVMPSKSLFNKLVGTYKADVFRRRRNAHPNESPSARDEDDAAHTVVYDRLFPGAPSRARRTDVEGVKKRFEDRMAVIHQHRDKNIAHAREVTEKKEARPAMLKVAEAVDALDYCDELYNDLRGVLGGAYRSLEPPLTPAGMNSHLLAERLVDALVLHPSLAPRALGDRANRTAIYEALHQRHDASGDKRPLFNWSDLST